MNKTAIITGITGQDGAYLADFLIGKGYRVIGTFRRTSSVNFWRIAELGILGNPALELVEHDVTDLASSIRLIEKSAADELYNLAAQSFVGVSFDQPIATANITGVGALNLLEAARSANPGIRFYQASTSEMFGKAQTTPQNEKTPFWPRSPYGFSKLFAHWAAVNYRESFGMFACSGLLFNHESPLRGKEFVTRKITDGVARIRRGELDALRLGNLDAGRDWGFARDYVVGMWLMLQAGKPDNYVLATGQQRTVRDFVLMAFEAAGMSVEFSGEGQAEVARDTRTGKILVSIAPEFYRPAEVDTLIGDSSYAEAKLGWKATTSVETLCAMMVEADLQRQERGLSF